MECDYKIVVGHQTKSAVLRFFKKILNIREITLRASYPKHLKDELWSGHGVDIDKEITEILEKEIAEELLRKKQLVEDFRRRKQLEK